MDKQIVKTHSVHGGDIYTEGLLKGRELLDFSSNINPMGISKSFTEHIEEGLKKLQIYPDIQYRELRSNLINYLGVNFLTQSNIALGNGAAEVIDLVISCFKKILIVVPSFAEYELDSKNRGLQILFSSLNENMEPDYKDILLKLERTDAIIMGNPNNPNGRIINKDSFFNILTYAENNNKTVILDEAFIEFTGAENNSFIKELERYNCIFIIRALTKFFSMPGIRFGYGISKNESLIREISKKQNPWNINCFAELAVKYVLKDERHIQRGKSWIREELNYFPPKLQNINYINKVFPTDCNFVLCQLKNLTNEQLYTSCLQKGIVIRRASNFRTLDQQYVRFAIKDRESNDRLLKTLKEIEEEI